MWETALRRGIIYGSSTATWQLADAGYRRLFTREAAILFTEDDLLWYRLRPSPDSGLNFSYADEIIGFAEDRGMLVFGAHLVWDQGFGTGWTTKDLWNMDGRVARRLLFGTIDRVVSRYQGRVTAWSVANEVLGSSGLRTDVPWHASLGGSYVAESFHTAHQADPAATLVLNDFGFETDDRFAPAAAKRASALSVLKALLADGVPVHALGLQAHLRGLHFAEAFDQTRYRRFLREVADLGLRILITEMDVLDSGLTGQSRVRDRGVADAMSAFLDVALDEGAVSSVMTFGLSDRYTWLNGAFPRQDGRSRRALPFDQHLRPTLAYGALRQHLALAPRRMPTWMPPRC